MDVKRNLKIRLQQKLVNIFHQIFKCLQYRHLEALKISIMYTEVNFT